MSPKRAPNAFDSSGWNLSFLSFLLTRGRDGFVAFVPPVATLDETVEFLAAAGVRKLG